MKKKITFTTFFLFYLLSTFCSYANNLVDTPGRKGQIPLILGGIKTEKENKATSQANLIAAQANQNAQKPDLEKQKDKNAAEAQRLFNQYNNKFEKGSAAYMQAQGEVNAAAAMAKSFQDQIDDLQKSVDNAQGELDAANGKLNEWQQKLLDLQNMSGADWNCFFDGKCKDLPFDPGKKPNFIMVPNTGAPGIFTSLTPEYKDRHKIDNKPIPPAQNAPPQKGLIDQATDKVKSYFNDIINQSRRIKNRVTAVLAVRG